MQLHSARIQDMLAKTTAINNK